MLVNFTWLWFAGHKHSHGCPLQIQGDVLKLRRVECYESVFLLERERECISPSNFIALQD